MADNSLTNLLNVLDAQGAASRAVSSASSGEQSAKNEAHLARMSKINAQVALKEERENAEELKRKFIFNTDAAAERSTIIEGLKGVIRSSLSELIRLDPNNPLLDKSYRDQIFDMFQKEEIEKIQKRRKDTGYEPVEITLRENNRNE